jgi:hypothetical protein
LLSDAKRGVMTSAGLTRFPSPSTRLAGLIATDFFTAVAPRAKGLFVDGEAPTRDGTAGRAPAALCGVVAVLWLPALTGWEYLAGESEN